MNFQNERQLNIFQFSGFWFDLRQSCQMNNNLLPKFSSLRVLIGRFCFSLTKRAKTVDCEISQKDAFIFWQKSYL